MRTGNRRGRRRDTEESRREKESRDFSQGESLIEEALRDYMGKKAYNRALKVAKKLKARTGFRGSSNGSSPNFGDANLAENFVWRKKFEKDIKNGFDPPELSLKLEKRRQSDRMAEIQMLNKQREERAIEKARREEDMAILAREKARAEFQDLEKKEAEFFSQQSKGPSITLRLPDDDNLKVKGVREEPGASEVSLEEYQVWHDKYCPRKPKYFIRVKTGYQWNKYNKTHYAHDSPPPKLVQGYKFDVFYPDLVDKSKVPTCHFERDGSTGETCLIRFHAESPYQDIAFRVANKDLDTSSRNGFKCTFESGILQVYFNFKRYGYRR